MTRLNRKRPPEGLKGAPNGDLEADDEPPPITIRWRACGPGLGERRGYVHGREVVDIQRLHRRGEYLLRFMCRDAGRFAAIAGAKAHAERHIEAWWAAWQAKMRAAAEAAERETEAAAREVEAALVRRERRLATRQRIATLREAIAGASQTLLALATEAEALIGRILADLEDGPDEGAVACAEPPT